MGASSEFDDYNTSQLKEALSSADLLPMWTRRPLLLCLEKLSATDHEDQVFRMRLFDRSSARAAFRMLLPVTYKVAHVQILIPQHSKRFQNGGE